MSITAGTASRPGSRSFRVALALAVLAGSAFGWTHPTFRAYDRARTSLVRVERFGQDANGDGIATAAEGRIDLDGDARFGETEAAFFAMPFFLEWAPEGSLPGPAELQIPNSSCVTMMGSNQRSKVCLLSPSTPGVTCVSTGITCFNM